MPYLRIILCLGLVVCFGLSEQELFAQQQESQQKSTQQERPQRGMRKGGRQKGNRGGGMDRQRGGRGQGGRGGGQVDQSLVVNEVAPDFKIKSLDGKTETQLASFKGKKPVVLIFGSYT